MSRAFGAEEREWREKKKKAGGSGAEGGGWGEGAEMALTFKVKLVDVFQRLVDKVETSKSLKRKMTICEIEIWDYTNNLNDMCHKYMF